VAYSEEAHAALISPLSTMTPKDPDGLSEDLLASDDRSIGSTISMLVALFLGLHDTLTDGPKIDFDKRLDWITRIKEELQRPMDGRQSGNPPTKSPDPSSRRSRRPDG